MEIKLRHRNINLPVVTTGAALVLLALLFGYYFNAMVVGYGTKNEEQSLLSRAITAASSFDPASFSFLKGVPEDIDNSKFKEIRSQLIRMKTANKDARFIYIMAMKSGKIIFLADAETSTSEDYSAPGDIYNEASANLKKIFYDGVPFVEGPFKDQWGEWVSGHAPIRDPKTTEIIAIIGIDIDAQVWRKNIFIYKWFSLLIAGLIFLIVFISFSALCYIYNVNNSLVTEVEERLLAENQLFLEKEKAQKYLDIAGVMFVVIDADQTVSLINQKGCEILGCVEQEVLGRNWFKNFIPKTNRSELEKYFQQCINGEIAPVDSFHNSVLTQDRDTKVISWHNTLLKDRDGSIVGVLCSGEDVTRQQELEEGLRQAQKMEAISTMAGGIAHNFNNILTSCIGFAELAFDEISKESNAYRNIEHVLTSANRAKGLVKSISEFSKREISTAKLCRPNILLQEFINSIKDHLPNQITIEQNINQDTEKIYIYPTQLITVIKNLYLNAIDAVQGRGGIIKLTLDNTMLSTDNLKGVEHINPGQYIKLTVNDTGHGMTSKIRERIFEPFFTTKEVGKGEGVGLSVVYGIVEKNGGLIQVESEVGKGSSFKVFFPRANTTNID